jgi:hypothetical protein
MVIRTPHTVAQIGLEQIWLFLAGITVPIFIYFVKLEIRVRKVEELEHKLEIDARLKQLESDPVFIELRKIGVKEAVSIYRAAGGTKNESGETRNESG